MAKDEFTKSWIIENSLEIISRYPPGMLTIRALHYQLVAIGMTNTQQHYKRVVNAMGDARREGLVPYNTFSDRDRYMVGETAYEVTNLDDKINEGQYQIKAWMQVYRKNRWENQPYYPEILIEKKALEGVFKDVAAKNKIAIGACKGYPSLTFLHELAGRFNDAISEGKIPVILYFGDYDPSGEDIPRSIAENLKTEFGVSDIEVRRIALMEEQVKEWRLPPAPAKKTDSRTANWDGLGQVELDAVRPEKLISLCQEAIDELFDYDLLRELEAEEAEEKEEYQKALKEFVNEL